MTERNNLTVFFDGACPLCRREIGFYRRQRGADAIDWVDVSLVTGATVVAGLSREAAMRRFHVRLPDGALIDGGRAFAALWSALPAFRPFGLLFRPAPLASLLDLFYDRFVILRPRLQQLVQRITSGQRGWLKRRPERATCNRCD